MTPESIWVMSGSLVADGRMRRWIRLFSPFLRLTFRSLFSGRTIREQRVNRPPVAVKAQLTSNPVAEDDERKMPLPISYGLVAQKGASMIMTNSKLLVLRDEAGDAIWYCTRFSCDH